MLSTRLNRRLILNILGSGMAAHLAAPFVERHVLNIAHLLRRNGLNEFEVRLVEGSDLFRLIEHLDFDSK